jgi:hypothetical protein
MRLFLIFFLSVGFAGAGCTSKSKAREQARAAYTAGQYQGALRMQQAQMPSVHVVGQIRNPMVPWTEGLTVAQAIVAAEYFGKSPKAISVIRNNEEFPIDPKQLLKGEDFELNPGDILRIQQ